MDINDLTVIIPTKNESSNIQGFLKSLPVEINLIIVDSSTDDTPKIIELYRSENTTVLAKDCNIPQARQYGAEQAHSEWLLYSDADMVFAEDYFQNLERLSLAENTGAIMGAKLSHKKFQWYYILYSLSMRFWAALGIPIGSGSNMLIRRSALLQIGGFDEMLTHSEDSDILIRIRKAGWGVPFFNSLEVFETDHRRLEQGIFKKFLHGGLRTFMLYTGLFRNKVRQSDWGYWENNKKQKPKNLFSETNKS